MPPDGRTAPKSGPSGVLHLENPKPRIRLVFTPTWKTPAQALLMYQQCIQLIKTVLVFSFMRWQENEGILNTNRSLIYYSTSLQSVDGKTKTFKKPTLPFKPSRLESDFF